MVREDRLDEFCRLLLDPALAAEVLQLSDPAEVQAYAASHGIELSMEDVIALGDAIKTSQRQGELSEEELSGVAGGVKCYRNMERFFGLVGSLFNTIFTSPW